MIVFKAVLLALVAGMANDLSAASYPEKPVRFIVPIAPGGSNDIVARSLAQRLTASLQQSVVVDNRAGGGGIVGTEIAARATPDGYTLLMVNLSHVVNPAMFPKMPYDLLRDFTAISLLGSAPNVLVVFPQFQATSVKDLVTLAKKTPGKLLYASAGNASAPHLAMELFKLKTGTQIVHVPYKGSGPGLIALMATDVQVSLPVLSTAMPLVKSARLRPLAVTSPERAPALPDLPTVRESGVSEYEFSAWFGCVAPAAVPGSIVRRLNQEIRDALSNDEMKRQFSAQAMNLTGTSPEEFSRYLASEIRKWAGVVRAANIKVD